MEFLPNQLYHVFNRGNNNQKIFFTRENYLFFLRKIRKHLMPSCDILAYCLMPNHFHLMIYYRNISLENGNSISKEFSTILRSYTQAINKQEGRTGSLFQQKTKAKALIKEFDGKDYPFICFNYIHQNPVKANFVSKMEDWEFSSFRDYINLRDGSLPNKTLSYELLDINQSPGDFYKISYEVIEKELSVNFEC